MRSDWQLLAANCNRPNLAAMDCGDTNHSPPSGRQYEVFKCRM